MSTHKLKKQVLINKNRKNKTKTRKTNSKPAVYFTLFDYTQPFKVEIQSNNTNIKIYKQKSADNYTELVKSYKNVRNIFIGTMVPYYDDLMYKKNKHNTILESDKGNTILCEFENNKYVFIGEGVYEFTTDEPITEYYSQTIGGYPYPVAISNTYVYFLNNFGNYGYIKKDNYFKDFPEKYSWANYAYDRLHGTNNNGVKFSKIEKFTTKLKNHTVIHSYYEIYED